MWLPLLLLFSVSATITTKGGQQDDEDQKINQKINSFCNVKMQDEKNKGGENQRTDLYSATADFGIHLYQLVSSPTERAPSNFFMSPVAIFNDLGMLASGARGRTRDRILTTMCIDPEEERHKLNENFKAYVEHFKLEKTKLARIANWFFADESVRIFPTFDVEVRRYYYASIDRMDVKDPEKAVNKINKIVRKSTNGEIKEVVTEIDTKTRFILLDYVSFDEYWEKPFKPVNSDQQQQQDDNIKQDKKRPSKVPMMHRVDYYKVYKDEDVLMVQVPYKGPLSLLLFKPLKVTLHEIEQTFHMQLIERYLSEAETSQLDLYIPKISFEQETDLQRGMQKMGVDIFFHPDLSGITPEPGLRVAHFYQKIKIATNEEEMDTSGAAVNRGISGVHYLASVDAIKVFFDKPFFMVIYDSSVNTIVGLGRYSEPLME